MWHRASSHWQVPYLTPQGLFRSDCAKVMVDDMLQVFAAIHLDQGSSRAYRGHNTKPKCKLYDAAVKPVL